MKIACESLDRIATTEMRLPFLERNIIVREYNAVRKDGDPLTYTIANAILDSIKSGKDRFAIFTGFWSPVNFPFCESDGPIGAVVLGKAIEMLGGKVSYCVEKECIPAMIHMLDYLKCSHNMIPLDRKNGDVNTALRKQFDVAVFTEKCGPSAEGVYHYATGGDRNGEDSDLTGFVQRFTADGKLSIGVGDIGNEIGYGLIFDEAREIVELGKRCTCPKGEGIITCLATTYLLPSGISNIGCYAITAALGMLTTRADILHTPEDEMALIKIGTKEQLVDGGYGVIHDYIDGVPASTMCAVVEILRCLAVIVHDKGNRGF